MGDLAFCAQIVALVRASSHGRRAEVNARLRNLDRRVGSERKEGDLTNAQARYMRHEDRSIRQEERDMARSLR